MTAPPQGLYLVSVEYPPLADCGLRNADCELESAEEQALE